MFLYPLCVVQLIFFRCGHRLMIFQLFIRFFNSFQYFIISKNSQLRNMQPLSNLWRITVQFHISVHISHAFFLFPLGLNWSFLLPRTLGNNRQACADDYVRDWIVLEIHIHGNCRICIKQYSLWTDEETQELEAWNVGSFYFQAKVSSG